MKTSRGWVNVFFSRSWMVFASLWAALATAAPATLIIMRHAEKPAQGDELSAKGWERANALPKLAESCELMLNLPSPAAFYGMRAKEGGGSVRSIQTLEPWAKSLGLKVQSPYRRQEGEKLIELILNDRKLDGKVVVIAWQHDTLTELMEALRVDPAPRWPDGVYDRLWRVDLPSGGGAPVFRQAPQRLLPGDSAR